MAIIDPEFKAKAKTAYKPFVNFVWSLVIIAFLFGMAAKVIWSGYPPFISFLEPYFEFVGMVGIAGLGLLIADKNPLVK